MTAQAGREDLLNGDTGLQWATAVWGLPGGV